MDIDEIAASPQPRNCPWGRKAIARLGKYLVRGSHLGDSDPTLEQYIGWHTEIVSYLWAALEVCDWDSLLGDDADLEVAGRPKTDRTLKEKLARLPTYPLHTIQDVSGVRLEARMTLDQQDEITEHVRRLGKLL